jgi:hypothetical protein
LQPGRLIVEDGGENEDEYNNKIALVLIHAGIGASNL